MPREMSLAQLLSLEGGVAAAYNSIAEETLKVFGKPEHFLKSTKAEHFLKSTKAEHFLKSTKETRHFDAADSKLDTDESTDIVTTVDDRLDYTFGRTFVAYIDLLAQKDRTNQEARADVVIGDSVLATGVPATFLLTMEGKLTELRKQLEAIPTLKPGPVWHKDPNEKNLWRTAEPQVTFRTRKTIKPFELAKATDKHPAQVDKLTEDVAIAKISTTQWSGMWTSAQKSDILARLDVLLTAVKDPRQRANRVVVVPMNIGRPFAEFLLRGPNAENLPQIGG